MSPSTIFFCFFALCFIFSLFPSQIALSQDSFSSESDQQRLEIFTNTMEEQQKLVEELMKNLDIAKNLFTYGSASTNFQ